MESQKTLSLVDELWEKWFIEGLSEFIKIPNLTPLVDPNYATNGLLEQAIDLVDSYV